MKENIASIIQWHTETFPNATLEGQLQKFEDEKQEYADENEKNFLSDATLMELADLIIVACGIARFDMLQGINALYFALRVAYAHSFFMPEVVAEAVQQKMQINRKRKWSIGKGNYQHVDE